MPFPLAVPLATALLMAVAAREKEETRSYVHDPGRPIRSYRHGSARRRAVARLAWLLVSSGGYSIWKEMCLLAEEAGANTRWWSDHPSSAWLFGDLAEHSLVSHGYTTRSEERTLDPIWIRHKISGLLSEAGRDNTYVYVAGPLAHKIAVEHEPSEEDRQICRRWRRRGAELARAVAEAVDPKGLVVDARYEVDELLDLLGHPPHTYVVLLSPRPVDEEERVVWDAETQRLQRAMSKAFGPRYAVETEIEGHQIRVRLPWER